MTEVQKREMGKMNQGQRRVTDLRKELYLCHLPKSEGKRGGCGAGEMQTLRREGEGRRKAGLLSLVGCGSKGVGGVDKAETTTVGLDKVITHQYVKGPDFFVLSLLSSKGQ